MKGKAAKIALLMLLTFTMAPIVYAVDFTTGIYFQGASGGLITFDQDFTASQLTFNPNLVFTGLVWNVKTHGALGFDASTGANMTITKIGADEIDYTVNAPTSTTSTTKIFVGEKGKPTNVAGCSSWSYNKNLKTVSVDVEHNSPAYIVVEWHRDIVQEYINRTYLPIIGMISIVVLAMITTVILGAMGGTPIDVYLIFEIITVIILMSLGGAILISLFFSF